MADEKVHRALDAFDAERQPQKMIWEEQRGKSSGSRDRSGTDQYPFHGWLAGRGHAFEQAEADVAG